MKAFEVKVAIIGGSKDETKTYFVEAKTKQQIKDTHNVLKIWDRPDMKPEQCPMEIIDSVIFGKEGFNYDN